jgi:hypothetical protein
MMLAVHSKNVADGCGPVHKALSNRVTLPMVVASLTLGISNGYAQEPDELEQFRELIRQQQRIIERQQQRDEQQQREIEALEQQVRALQEASQKTGRLAEDAKRQVDSVRHDVAQAQDDAGQARELAAAVREVTIERSQEGLGDWTRSVLGAPPSEPAEKEEVAASKVFTEPEAFSVSIGGQINRAINVADDGNQTKTYFVDNGNLPTFAYLKASAPVTDDLTLGGQISVSLQDNSANVVNQHNESAGFSSSGRLIELTADSKTYGRLSFGKGFAAAFFLAEADKSGTYADNLLSVGNTAGGLQFFDKDTDSLSGISVGEVFVDIEGINLINRARYDSPVWNGLQVSADAGENQFSDIALRWNRDIGDFGTTVVGSGQINPQGGRVDWRVDGGIGVLHKPTGLNLTGGMARQGFEDRSKNSDGYIVRAGLRRNWFDIGQTKTAIDYTSVWDITEDGDKGRSAGAFLVQEIDKWNMEVYAGYRWYDYDRDTERLDSINVFNVGARYWFGLTATAPKSDPGVQF